MIHDTPYTTDVTAGEESRANQVTPTVEGKQSQSVSGGDTRLTPHASGRGESSRGANLRFQTVTPIRDGECHAADCRVLITGCGRSGTHFLAEQLAAAGEARPLHCTLAFRYLFSCRIQKGKQLFLKSLLYGVSRIIFRGFGKRERESCIRSSTVLAWLWFPFRKEGLV